jgi:hypothetical protein
VKIELNAAERRWFFAWAYPARSLLGTKEALKTADTIIGYNETRKVFNVFATTKDPKDLRRRGLAAAGSVLCVRFDQDTDDLEILLVGVEDIAGRPCRYKGDYLADPKTEMFDLYQQDREGLREEAKKISRRIDLGDKFGGEWK